MFFFAKPQTTPNRAKPKKKMTSNDYADRVKMFRLKFKKIKIDEANKQTSTDSRSIPYRPE